MVFIIIIINSGRRSRKRERARRTGMDTSASAGRPGGIADIFSCVLRIDKKRVGKGMYECGPKKKVTLSSVKIKDEENE